MKKVFNERRLFTAFAILLGMAKLYRIDFPDRWTLWAKKFSAKPYPISRVPWETIVEISSSYRQVNRVFAYLRQILENKVVEEGKRLNSITEGIEALKEFRKSWSQRDLFLKLALAMDRSPKGLFRPAELAYVRTGAKGALLNVNPTKVLRWLSLLEEAKKIRTEDYNASGRLLKSFFRNWKIVFSNDPKTDLRGLDQRYNPPD